MTATAAQSHGRVRAALPHDRGAAEAMIREFLAEMHERGSEVLPTDRSVDFYMGVFDSYVDGAIPGAAIISGGWAGISMAGHPHPLDLSFGETATGWLTYVRPQFRGTGLGSALRALLRQTLRDHGFTAIAAGYHAWNESSIRLAESRGFQSRQIYGYESLAATKEIG